MFVNNGAIISKNQKYRYRLWRIWDNDKPLIFWIMLNPSTADENYDDPTIKKCIKFSTAWGYGGLYVGNLFAYRATNPKELLLNEDIIVGPKNASHLYDMKIKCKKIICAWGNLPRLKNIQNLFFIYFLLKMEKLYCLGINKSGEPKHPLYIKDSAIPIEYIYDKRTVMR